MQGLIGKKKGMTQIWDDAGNRVAVTVIEVGPCPVVQVKTLERDGYVAAQLGFGEQKAKRLTKGRASDTMEPRQFDIAPETVKQEILTR